MSKRLLALLVALALAVVMGMVLHCLRPAMPASEAPRAMPRGPADAASAGTDAPMAPMVAAGDARQDARPSIAAAAAPVTEPPSGGGDLTARLIRSLTERFAASDLHNCIVDDQVSCDGTTCMVLIDGDCANSDGGALALASVADESHGGGYQNDAGRLLVSLTLFGVHP